MKDSIGQLDAEARDLSIRSINRHGFHRIAYREWGDPDCDHAVFCVHGLTRNSHDFDPIARVLAEDHRVVCPDLVGRGRSGRLSNPNDYHLLQYNLDMLTSCTLNLYVIRRCCVF